MRSKGFVTLITALLIAFGPAQVFAHGHATDPIYFITGSDENTLKELSHLIRDLAVLYSVEMQRGSDGTILSHGISGNEDRYFMDERQDQARFIAETALRSVIRQTVEQVDIFNTLKAYGERITTAQLTVRGDQIQFQAPSLQEAENQTRMADIQKNGAFSIRSGVSVMDKIHPSPMLQANLADMSSKVIYNPFGGGDWEFSLAHPIAPQSSIEMVYLLKSPEDQNLLATIRFSF